MKIPKMLNVTSLIMVTVGLWGSLWSGWTFMDCIKGAFSISLAYMEIKTTLIYFAMAIFGFLLYILQKSNHPTLVRSLGKINLIVSLSFLSYLISVAFQTYSFSDLLLKISQSFISRDIWQFIISPVALLLLLLASVCIIRKKSIGLPLTIISVAILLISYSRMFMGYFNLDKVPTLFVLYTFLLLRIPYFLHLILAAHVISLPETKTYFFKK